MSIKRLTTKILSSVLVISLILTGLIASLVFSSSIIPFIPPIYASATSSASKNLTLTASVKDALSLALSSNTISLDLTPTPNGIFKTDTFDATVSTSNQTGYTLYVASTGLDHNGEVTSNLIHSSPDVSSDSVISPLEGAVVATKSGNEYTDTSAFAANRYGLSTDTTTFKPVSITNNIFNSHDSNIEGDTTNFTFGTKVDTNIVAGTYSNTLTVTAIANPVYRTFTINYHPAGGIIDDSSLVLDEATGVYVYSDRIADEYYPEITISSTTPVKTGHTFLGYAISEEAAAEGTVTYQPGDKISMDYESPSISLYAVWETNTYTLVYNANTGTGAPGSQSMTYGQNITLSATVPTKTGYTFLGWSLSSTATSATYSANTAYAVSTITDAAGITSHNGDSATLYAVWKINTYTVTVNVGTGVSRSAASISVNYGSSNTVTITPSTGYYLSGASCTNGYTTNASTGASYVSAQTVTIKNNSKLAASTCTFTASKRSFTATISLAGSGLSRSASSISVVYGSSNTVTITASSGYYISAASCTNGYTVSVTTGVNGIGAKTATIYNQSKVANSTCTFTGAALTPAQACAKITSTHGTYYAGGTLMIKLKDGKCWTKNTVATATWANAASACSTRGMTLPTAAQVKTLVQQYGGTFRYNEAGTGSPYGTATSGTNTLSSYIPGGPHWTSTSYDSTHAWFLTLYANTDGYPMVRNGVYNNYLKTTSNGILCIGA